MRLPHGHPAPTPAALAPQLPCRAAPLQGQPRRRGMQPFALWLVQEGGKGAAAGRGTCHRPGEGRNRAAVGEPLQPRS